MPVAPDPPAALLGKYDDLLALRRAHARGDARAPVAALRALAANFPGALRELDRLPLEELERRRCACVVAQDGGGCAPVLLALGAYHALLREALRLKRDPGATSDEGELTRLLRGPASERGGRLERVVLPLVAERVGLAEGEVRALLFPRPPRARLGVA